jgi:phosphatidylglycerophosphate synthase
MTTPEEVLYYVPNLIGYGRVISTIVSFLLMIAFPERWFLATWLYIFSFVGDLFDGMVARKLNQTSEFGGLLDMVTDRCSTLGLLFVLSGDYATVDFQIGFPVYRLVRGIFASRVSSNVGVSHLTGWDVLLSSLIFCFLHLMWEM